MLLNRIIVALMIGLVPIQVSAHLKVSLETEVNLGKMRTLTFEKMKEGYRLNGLRLDPQMVYLHPKALHTMLKTEKVEQGKCPAGTYSLVIKSKKVKKENGCLGTERFAQLERAFATLRGFDLLQ